MDIGRGQKGRRSHAGDYKSAKDDEFVENLEGSRRPMMAVRPAGYTGIRWLNL
jgi:hypothetical protein